MLVFEERGKLEDLEKNLSEQGQEPTTNSTHMTRSPGIEPGPHWWEVSALTTASSLLLNDNTLGFHPRAKSWDHLVQHDD